MFKVAIPFGNLDSQNLINEKIPISNLYFYFIYFTKQQFKIKYTEYIVAKIDTKIITSFKVKNKILNFNSFRNEISQKILIA